MGPFYYSKPTDLLLIIRNMINHRGTEDTISKLFYKANDTIYFLKSDIFMKVDGN